jgi:hypothetical protein
MNLSELQLNRLSDLMQNDSAFLRKPMQNKLEVLQGLCRAEGTTRIAARLAVTAERVKQLDKELADRDIDQLLLMAENAVAEAKERAATRRSERGRPGYDSFDEWATLIAIDQEPVCEIASLMLGRRNAIVVFATKTGGPRSGAVTGKRNLDHEAEENVFVDELFEISKDAPAWSAISNSDDIMKETIATMRDHIFEHDDDRMPAGSLFTPAKARFPREYQFFAMSTGIDNELEELVLDQLELEPQELERLVRPDGFSFFGWFERALFSVRQKRSCVGLFPTFFELYNEVNDWSATTGASFFVYETNLRDARLWIRRRAVAQHYFAAQGALFEANRWLWNQLPFVDECNFLTVPLRTKVTLTPAEPTPGRVGITLRPLPEIAYSMSVPWRDPAPKALKHIRKRLREDRSTVRLRYSNRIPDGSTIRRSIFLPEDYFDKPRDGDHEGGVGVVLLPRHTFCPQPALPLPVLAGVAKEAGSGLWRIQLAARLYPETTFGGRRAAPPAQPPFGSRTLWIFRSIALEGALAEACLKGRYTAALDRLGRWQGQLIAQSRKSRTTNNVDWLIAFMGLNAYAPDYFFGEDCSKSSTEEKVTAAKAQLPGLQWQQIIEDGEARERENAAFEPVMRMDFGSLVPPDSEPTLISRTFIRLLKDFDADFFLVHLDAGLRKIVDADAESWTEQLQTFLMEHVASVEEFRPDRVRKNIPYRKFRSKYSDDEIRSTCSTLLRKFTPVRILRASIENAQRLVLDGLQAYAVFAIFEDYLLEDCYSFLGRHIVRAIPAEAQTSARIYENFNPGLEDKEEQPTDERAISILVAEAVAQPSETNLRKFFEMSWQYTVDDWVKAVREDRCPERLIGALQLCRPPNSEKPKVTPELLRQLAEIFAGKRVIRVKQQPKGRV